MRFSPTEHGIPGMLILYGSGLHADQREIRRIADEGGEAARGDSAKGGFVEGHRFFLG